MQTGGLCPLPIPLGGNAESGWSAEQHARACADLRACVRTLPFAVMRLTVVAGVSVSVADYIGRNGAGLAHAPTPVFNGVGDYGFTWSAAYSDDYGTSEPVSLRSGRATASAVTSIGGKVVCLSRNTCNVLLHTTSTGAAVDSDCFVVVW